MTRHYNPAKQIFESEDDDPEDRITCTYCGTGGLHWKRVTSADGMSEKPTLFDSRNRRHVCTPNADDFSELA